MKYVISITGQPFQFSLGRSNTYSFDTQEPTAITDSDYQAIIDRIGSLCLKEVDAPAPADASVTPAESEPAPAPAPADASVGEPAANQQ